MKGRTVLYTGAAGGLGFETTLLMIERGATVVAVDRNRAKLAELEQAARNRGPGRLLTSDADMGDLVAYRTVLEGLLAEVDGFDIVINNAGIYPAKRFEEFTLEEYQAVQRVNVDAGVLAVQVCLPCMKERGFGRIINISSITVSGGWENLSPYVASKMALIGLTRAWAREFGPAGVTVNAIAPGAFPTDAEKIHPDPEGYERMVLDAQAIKRRGHAGDIANAIAFFTSDESGFITGQTLHVNGGWTMN
ncbi:SDR family NAD(P)-dependent oxidoreductase [Tsuneonella suprasediminis]|uniref:SDR family NAD(P)-dependent oxidoreductase n=1 Tax=Tsuneonella suprasediminis TaxID=2306996 RepID=UPI002F94A631